MLNEFLINRWNIRGNILIWPVLILSVIAILFLSFYKPGSVPPVYDERSQISDGTHSHHWTESRQACPQNEFQWKQWWSDLSESLATLPPEESLLTLADHLESMEEYGCDLNNMTQQNIAGYLANHPSDTRDFIARMNKENSPEQNPVEYQEHFEDYLRKKEELKHTVQGNLLPGEAFDEAYARELNRLRQDLFR